MEVPAYEGPRSEAFDGGKVDAVKARYDLVPELAMLEVTKALTIGAEKYDNGELDVQGWMHPNRTHRMLFSAERRHTTSRRLGEKVDRNTKCQHLALSIVNLLFILEADLRGWDEKDDFDPHCLKRPGVHRE